MSRYYDLVSASIEIDTSELQAKLEELEPFDASDLEERLSALEGLNTCGVDVNDLADVPSTVDSLSEDLASALIRIDTLESRNAELERNLGEWRATDLASLGERIERLEATSNLSYNFFALAGKMIALLLNGGSR